MNSYMLRNNISVEERKNCPICLEICNQSSVELPCKHQYHSCCLNKYLKHCHQHGDRFKCCYCVKSYDFNTEGKLCKDKSLLDLLKDFIILLISWLNMFIRKLSPSFILYVIVILVNIVLIFFKLDFTIVNEKNQDIKSKIRVYIYDCIMYTSISILSPDVLIENFEELIYYDYKKDDLYLLLNIFSAVYLFYSNNESNIFIYFITLIITLKNMLLLFVFLPFFLFIIIGIIYRHCKVDYVDLNKLKDINVTENDDQSVESV